MTQNVNFKAEKKNIQKGEIIILQGSEDKEIHFLHKGSIEIKRSGINTAGLKSDEIIKSSKRVGVIEAPSIFGVQNLISSTAHSSSFVAITDCQITKYIIPSNDFISFFKMNPPIALNVLITMLDQSRKRMLSLKKYVEFTGAIEKLSDNMMLLYLHVNGIKKDKLYQTFINNGGVIPPKIESGFLTSDFSTILEKTYGDPSYDPYVKFDQSKIEFFHNLIRTKPSVFISLISANIKIFLYIFQSLSNIINSINIETEKFASNIEDKLNTFFLDNSSPFNLIYASYKKMIKTNIIDTDVTKAIVKICRNIEHVNKQLGGREYIEVFPKYDALGAGGSSAEENRENVKVQSSGKYKKMFKDSTKHILDFSTLSNDAKDRIKKNLSRMQKINPEELLSKDTRNLIKRLQDDYFELYLNLFLKLMKKPGNIPDCVKLFFYFSFIDENIINEKQLEFIYNSLPYFTKEQNTEFPIITLFDYLMLIYNKDEEPSLSERGEFRKIITKMFTKNEKKIEDTPQGRLDFEIDNMARNSMRVISDNIRAFIPYLREESFKGPLSQILISPKKLDAFMKKILSIDYSLFYRELTWKIPGKSELIQKEIKPFLILAPISGVRIQMWQELVYNIRSTRGRFVIPVIFNGDLNKNLIFACGHFRWNLNKALVSNWMDPVDGGLSGAYYDYEQTYKKMTELSIEAKDKIKKQISSIKIDRNRFAHDYYEWLIFESKGVPKLNKVLRKIFYRLIPFPKEIRDNIAKLPVYMDLDRKFNIIRNRDFKKIEVRYKKYTENEKMPDDLQKYLDVLQR